MLAIGQGHERMAEVLLNKGANPTLADEGQMTPLERAGELKQERLVAILRAAMRRADASAQALERSGAQDYRTR